MQGLITFVSNKTKGIKLDNKEEWYNPKGEAKDKMQKSMEGHRIKFDVLPESNSFTDFQLQEKEVMNKDDYWQRKEERDIQQDRARGRGAALNTSVEIIKAALQTGHNTAEIENQDDFLDEAKKMADKIFTWTQGGK